ncbi:hypothetical protein WMY93_015029 [Mugilogobius chulae]|uniref:B box-type domain-containing protein n=1 Tax=Mugilogobius chulae TaxID=88201 RepID=A0AAW0P2X1_9GOBI
MVKTVQSARAGKGGRGLRQGYVGPAPPGSSHYSCTAANTSFDRPHDFRRGHQVPQHGKLVEYYCLDDLTCVCVSCAIEDQHRLHNMKTFSTAHKELLEKLLADHKELLFKTDDDNLSLEKWEKNESMKVTKSSVRLIEAISNLRDLTLTSVQTSVSARMVAIQTSKNSIQAAQNEKDTYRFLQLYSQVHQDVEKAKAADLRKGLVPGPDREKLIKEINSDTIIEQSVDLWGSLLVMVDPENHQEIIPTSKDIFFQPQTFPSGMFLSSDKREVFYCRDMGQCSAVLLIRSTASADITRWIISLPQDYNWIIGLCDKQRVNNVTNGPVYGLSFEENQLSVLSTKHLSTKPESKESSNSASGFPTLQEATPKNHRTSTRVLSSPGKDGVDVPETVEVVLASSVLSFFGRSGHSFLKNEWEENKLATGICRQELDKPQREKGLL